MIRAFIAAAVFMLANHALAHSSSNSFISVNQENSTVAVRIDLPLRDMDLRFDFDRNLDRAITWQEIKQQAPAVMQWLTEGIAWSSESGVCRLGADHWAAAQYADEYYLSIEAPLNCDQTTPPKQLKVRYQLFFDQDTLHRGLIKATIDQTALSAVFSPDRPEVVLDQQKSGFFWVAATYLVEGIWHIWIGADHILFLLSLLLPCVFLGQSQGNQLPDRVGRWQPVQAIKPAIMNVLAVVTAFTVAHSITLGLTVFDILNPPSDLIEPMIAASVVVAALGNLTKRLIHLRWQIAFGFGLIHGFGFASVLADLGLPSGQLTAALLGFNLGVELGQLAIVGVFFPIAWKLRATALYRWGFVVAGSIAIAAIAAYWLVQRIAY
jgi:hypothetical protein